MLDLVDFLSNNMIGLLNHITNSDIMFTVIKLKSSRSRRETISETLSDNIESFKIFDHTKIIRKMYNRDGHYFSLNNMMNDGYAYVINLETYMTTIIIIDMLNENV